MKVTLLGTGCPIPTAARAGTALVVTVGDTPLLVDCGPRTVYELMENEVNPGAISEVFFTHHHVDHNAAFHHFAIVSWTAGRSEMTVYGPDGTDRLVDALYDVYEDDLEYRAKAGYPKEGIENIEWVPVEDGFRTELDDVTVTARPVEHSIETYAYRFETGAETLVFTGDTGKFDGLAEFAAGADVLVNDAHMAPVGDPPEEGFVWEKYTEPYSEETRAAIGPVHCTPTEAAEVASEAGVDTLVLTHFPPYRDVDAIREAASAAFDGEIHVGEDGLTVDVAGARAATTEVES